MITEERPKRPNDGPGAFIDTSEAAINKILEQTLPNDIYDSMLALETLSELEVYKICKDNKLFDDLQEATTKNSSETIDDALNCKKSTDTADGITSDLMKFSMTDSYIATNERTAHTIVSVAEEQLPVPVIIDDSEDSPNAREHCQEVTSQELPVSFNVQSTMPNEEVSSEYLPVFLNNSVQSTASNEEMPSECLPVFVNNSERSG